MADLWNPVALAEEILAGGITDATEKFAADAPKLAIGVTESLYNGLINALEGWI